MFRARAYRILPCYLSLAAHLGVPSPAAAACDAGGVLSTFAGECTYANFLAHLDADCRVGDLFPDADGPAAIAEACAFSATAFVEIQGTYQRDRRYFAGGGPLVDGGRPALDGARLRRFEDNMASNTLIGFPEYAARQQYNEDHGLGANGYPANLNLETGCDLNTVMCCFTEGDFAAEDDGETDVCRHDLRDSPQSNHIKQGWSVFPYAGDGTSTHCVGFTWQDGSAEEELLGNMMYDISLRNSANKDYLKGVFGAPMCGCLEHMPVVEQAACRTAALKDDAVTYSFFYEPPYGDDEGYVYATNSVGIEYANCAAGDLKAQYVANHAGDTAAAALIEDHLVGAGGCADDVTEYLNEEHFLIQHRHDTKYVTPDPDRWSGLVVGEGIYFLPAAITREEADGDFRDLINAGCKDRQGNPRYCLVRRVCATCAESHRDIYYQRRTELPSADSRYFLDLFMNNWVSEQNSMTAGDFALYSSYDDALVDKDAWTHCNYDEPGIGFPRDCGPTGHVGSNWNSYTRHGGHANHHGYYVEKPAGLFT